MGDGFTGFNVNEAQKKINDYSSVTGEIDYMFRWGVTGFLQDIGKNWYSPNAVEFGRKYESEFRTIYMEFSNTFTDMYNRMVNAYNFLASANNVGTLTPENLLDSPADFRTDDIGFFEVSSDGKVGMDKDKVTKLFADFKSTVIESIISKLDSLPTSIAFYDANGNLHAAYDAQITKAKRLLTDALTVIKAELDIAIVKETDSVFESMQKAVDVLNG